MPNGQNNANQKNMDYSSKFLAISTTSNKVNVYKKIGDKFDMTNNVQEITNYNGTNFSGKISVAISNEYLAVGQPGNRNTQWNRPTGAVYVFKKDTDGDGWSEFRVFDSYDQYIYNGTTRSYDSYTLSEIGYNVEIIDNFVFMISSYIPQNQPPPTLFYANLEATNEKRIGIGGGSQIDSNVPNALSSDDKYLYVTHKTGILVYEKDSNNSNQWKQLQNISRNDVANSLPTTITRIGTCNGYNDSGSKYVKVTNFSGPAGSGGKFSFDQSYYYVSTGNFQSERIYVSSVYSNPVNYSNAPDGYRLYQKAKNGFSIYWHQDIYALPSQGAFGRVHSDGETLIVTAPTCEVDGTQNKGVLLVFTKNSGKWALSEVINSGDSTTYFGDYVSIFGDLAIASYKNTSKIRLLKKGSNSGSKWDNATKTTLQATTGSLKFIFNNEQLLVNNGKVYNNNQPYMSPEENTIVNNLGTTFSNKLKLVSFSTSVTGFKEVDSTRGSEIKSYLASASDKADRRSKRLNLIKYLFLKNKSLKKIRLNKSDLNLPSAFVREKAVIIKAGETFNVSDLSNNEGFYAVLEDDESVRFTLDNVTVKFTRNDDISSGDERYYITDENDDDLNTDNVNIREPPETNQGTFSDTDTSGYLVEDDIIIIDGRKFLIGSVGDGQNSNGSAGDPYVFPLKSNTPVKLPNKPAVYRMFEQGNNYVNIEVDMASDEHKKRMFEYARKFTPVTHNIVMDGYFYKKLFISAEGNDIVIDYNTKKASCNEEALKFFEMTNFKKRFECGEFFEDCMCYNIKWKTCENKRVDVQVLFFPNPHIENGINIIPQTLKNTTGMMIDNYKPKLMEIPSLTTKKFSKLHRKLNNSKNIHQKMNIKGKNEKWYFN